MNRRYLKNIWIGLLLFPYFHSFAQSEDFNAVFADLIYDPTKSYTNGSAVVISLEDGEIYTASLDVPAASDGSNGPNGANASTYWGDSSTTTQQFERNNPTFLDDLPSNIDTAKLSTAVAQLTNPTNATTPSGLTSASNEAFVMQQYLDFLGRDGDAEGIAYWKGELDNGTQTRADCVNNFVFSEEFQAKVAPVSRIYLAYFLRIPDTGGLEFWINEKLAGKTISDISDSFAASTEFQNTYGSLNNADFVNLVYTNLFNRAADSGGFSYWKGQLDNGIDNRGTVMASFSESQENITLTESNIRVISFYYGMLRRAPEQGGYDFWVNELKIGKSPNDLINGFISSAEYQQRF